jgi:hypothetical protein
MARAWAKPICEPHGLTSVYWNQPHKVETVVLKWVITKLDVGFTDLETAVFLKTV